MLSRTRWHEAYSCAFNYYECSYLHLYSFQKPGGRLCGGHCRTMLGISRISLNKHVKAAFNVTDTQLIKRRLLSEIQSQLIYSNKTTSEIAFDFSEPNHLMRFFKILTNETISEFLSNHHRNIKLG